MIYEGGAERAWKLNLVFVFFPRREHFSRHHWSSSLKQREQYVQNVLPCCGCTLEDDHGGGVVTIGRH